jgi:methionyl-tRNA synthetase
MLRVIEIYSSMSERIPTITTPIFYPNGTPHIGHFYSVLIADAWRRAHQLLQKPHFMSTGLDEHGQKVANAAATKNIPNQMHVDEMSNVFCQSFKTLDLSWSAWVRTTAETHKEAVRVFWRTLETNGYIYKKKYSGYYSITAEEYVDAASDNAVWREEECYYFKLSAFEDDLKKYFAENPDFIKPHYRYNEAIGFLNQGLHDFPISRPKERLNWGIEVPNDPTQVIYVWIDALVNYLSIIGYPNESYKQCWPATHILGKDILKFHAIYWPALLMAAKIPLPKALIVHGWWLQGDAKISKSLGNNIVDIDSIVQQYTPSGVRLFLLSHAKLGADAQLTKDGLDEIVHGFLANKYINLLLRIIGIMKRNDINKLVDYADYSDNEIFHKVGELRNTLNGFMDDPAKLNIYLDCFMNCVRLLNEYVSRYALWQIENITERAARVSFVLDMYLKITHFIWPAMPELAEKTFIALGLNIIHPLKRDELQVCEEAMRCLSINK